jgi:predicted DCC family thiol-disulfide oxidoreductase YuxK
MAEELSELSAEGPIVFYDGECGLCDRFVKRLFRADRHQRIRYATLQGETAARVFGPPQGASGAWSVKLLENGQKFERSTAALRALAAAGGAWQLSKLLLVVPRPIRDAVYRFVAEHRYQWFGKIDACMMPTPALQKRFRP